VSTVVCVPWIVRLPDTITSLNVTSAVVLTSCPIWTPVAFTVTPVPAVTFKSVELAVKPSPAATCTPEELDTKAVLPTTASDLVDVKSPPPDRPLPAVTETELWFIFSLATYPDKLWISILLSLIKIPDELDTTWV
jgi:hypothetical protein